jgi:hypothetical protein
LLAIAALLANASATRAQDDCLHGDCAPGAHGHHLGRHGHHGHHGHHGLLGHHGHHGGYGWYPNAIDNYGHDLTKWDFAGPGGYKTCPNGNCQYRHYGQPDLFYNYYAWPSCTGVGAELYLSPRPIPPHVGHTYITYQPLYPHEFLYTHHRTYHRYYNGGQGLNRSHVHYWHSPFTVFRH